MQFHRQLNSLNTKVCKLFRRLCEVILLSMTIIVLAQVFFRYGLGDALTWSEEASRFLMVWLTFLAAPVAYLEKSHVALDIISGSLNIKFKRLLNIALHIFSFVLIVIMLWKSTAMVARGLSISTASLPLSMAYAYAALPCGFLAMLSICFQHLIAEVIGKQGESS